MKRKVFYSFHYDNDVFRVQQIRNIGVLEGDEPVSKNEWETVKRGGDTAIRNWIDKNMKYKDCVVLIGSETASRPWVNYEIQKALDSGKALLGIHIHNLKDMQKRTCQKGANPFDNIRLQNGWYLSDYVKCHDPNSWDAYNDIADHLGDWVEDAIRNKRTQLTIVFAVLRDLRTIVDLCIKKNILNLPYIGDKNHQAI